MTATTDTGTRRQSPARWSKLAATTLSVGALLGIVHVLSSAAAEPAVTPSGAGAGGGLSDTATIRPALPASVPAAVPAPVPPLASAATVAPQGVSKASGG